MKRPLLAITLALLLAPAVAIAQTHLLIISGLGGQAEFDELFQNRSLTLLNAAESIHGIAPTHTTYLASDPEVDPEHIDGRSDKAGIQQAFTTLSDRVQTDDTIVIVLIGHGNTRGKDVLFNIPGPDISAEEFATLLEPFSEQTTVFVNTTAASGPFVKVLSAPKRVVITATASGTERFFAVFGGHFVAALAEAGADTNKDNRVSVLEAFEYARREALREYTDDNRLPTEHALLDDNGDGEGSREPDPQTNDGALARTLFFRGAPGTGATRASANPAVFALLEEKQVIEQRIDALRQRKTELAETDYDDQLEVLLVEMALKHRAIREQEDTP